MRISGGDARGIRLRVPGRSRPTSERVRQAIFSSLAVHVPGARVLDLYCGSGAFGLEALSRGADEAVFVDRDREALACASQNASAAGLDDNARFRGQDVHSYLARAAANEGPFDLIFADPPYAEASELGRVLSAAAVAAASEARLVCEGPKKLAVLQEGGWILEADRTYGDTRILVYRREGVPVAAEPGAT